MVHDGKICLKACNFFGRMILRELKTSWKRLLLPLEVFCLPMLGIQAGPSGAEAAAQTRVYILFQRCQHLTSHILPSWSFEEAHFSILSAGYLQIILTLQCQS